MENVEESSMKPKKVKEAFVHEPKVEKIHEEDDDDDEDDDEEDDEFGFDMDDMNLTSILQNFLVNEDGVNVCDVLTGLKKSLDTQNKILMKIVNNMEKKKN